MSGKLNTHSCILCGHNSKEKLRFFKYVIYVHFIANQHRTVILKNSVMYSHVGSSTEIAIIK